jgi:putative endonuclease
MREKGGCVYIMASARNGTLYIGVTSDLPGRVWQHKEGVADGLTRKYGCKMLVWFEQCGDITLAIQREKQMKEWKRLWKLRVIEEMNPDWNDLYESLF